MTRRDPPKPGEPAEPFGGPCGHLPEGGEAALADSVVVALLVALDTLQPAERMALVLRGLFDLPFREIAGVVGRSPAVARQLAGTARRRLQAGLGADEWAPRPHRS